MQGRADFRNGKYEGQMNGQGQRHGLGLFIDDDLTFYISHWRNNKINGLSLIYIAHGKYIYGEWKDSEPNGLTVFRSGDTVLVGNCDRGRPSGKCLVIFQRFNFACVLQQSAKQWSVVSSGQLTNYNTLLQYIELMGTPVPDYFFSLTKFACHFSKHSAHVKALPCFGGCCYFGYSNGLALVFNAANGLVSVGSHQEQQVSEFGGKFQGTRWAQQGNFQKGGEKIRYSGERPSSKIYSIFQRMHKRSLDFHNEYFDSKVKYFTFIEEMLRSQLHLIAHQCRRDKHLRHVDLSQSLDYQECTEEQSLKINSIRDILYEAPPSTKEQPDRSRSTKFFKKPQRTVREMAESQVSDSSKQKEEPRTPKSTFKQSTAKANYSIVKRSPIKETSEFIPESHKKLSDCESQRIGKIARESSEQPPTPSKLRDRMKSNNLRYINNSNNILIQAQCQQKRQKPGVPPMKSNNIYREIKARKEESTALARESLADSQESQNYKVPNFKCLNNQSDRPNCINKQLSPSSNNSHVPKDAFMPQTLQTHQKPKAQPTPEASPQAHRKSINVSSLAKPSYEDMDERRKRILKDYRDLNQKDYRDLNQKDYRDLNQTPAPKQSQKPKVSNIQAKLDSPCNLAVFSLSKQEQSSFGYMPITMADRANIKRDKSDISLNRPMRPEGLYQRENNLDRTPNRRAELKVQKSFKFGSFIESSLPAQRENRVKPSVTASSTNVSIPNRVRKSYQYIYE